MKVKIRQLSGSELEELKVTEWPIWTCEKSEFDWSYSETEVCLILEGAVDVTTADGVVSIKAGDFVEFPAGLSCSWNVKEPIRKHYLFK